MPRVASALITRPRKSAGSGKAPPKNPLKFPCSEAGCPWSFRRPSDLARHAKQHLSQEEKEAIMIPCTIDDCDFKAFQKSNLDTHRNAVHYNIKPHVCGKCGYSTADPSCLNKHMNRCTSRKRRASSIASTSPEPSSSEYEWTSFSPESPSSSWISSPSPLSSATLDRFPSLFPSTPEHSSQPAVDDFDFSDAYPEPPLGDLSSWLELGAARLGGVPSTCDPAAPSSLYPAEQLLFAPEFIDAPFPSPFPQEHVDELLTTLPPPPVLDIDALPPSAFALHDHSSEPPSLEALNYDYSYPCGYEYPPWTFRREWNGVVVY